MKDKIVSFIKKDTLLVVSFVLAVVSAFVVHPSQKYLGYIDFRVLGILLSLMLVMAGLKKALFFDAIGMMLLRKVNGVRGLSMILVLLCFVFSMIITNDVALITFVPFAIYTLETSGQRKLILPVVVLQTLAANLGSMLMPIGNPQNLYIYNTAGMGIGDFVKIMLPYSGLSLLLIMICTFLLCRGKGEATSGLNVPTISVKEVVVYGLFFVLCLLVVLRVIHYLIPLCLILVYLLIFDRKMILKADYSLLLTFIFFFVFTGNLGNIAAVSDFLKNVVGGHEVVTSVVASQAISNVPATLLLAGFTENYHDLLIGVNLGGLGTLIASMASLISYKQFAQYDNDNKGKYFALFTVMNVAFLAILLGAWVLIR